MADKTPEQISQEELDAALVSGNFDAANAEIADAAKKAGIDPAGITRDDKGRFVAAKAEAVDEKNEDEVVEYQQEVELPNGRSIIVKGASEEECAMKGELALRAATAVLDAIRPPEVEKPKDEAKEKAAKDELDSLRVKLAANDFSVLDEYLDKSGAIDKILSRRGINVEEVKATLDADRTKAEVQVWEDATAAFKTENPDYYGSERNMKLLGYEIADIMNKAPNTEPQEAIELAYHQLSEKQWLDTASADKTPANNVVEPGKKKATSSAPFGTTGGNTVRGGTKAQSNFKMPSPAEFAQMNGQELADWWNVNVTSGNIPPDVAQQAMSRGQ